MMLHTNQCKCSITVYKLEWLENMKGFINSPYYYLWKTHHRLHFCLQANKNNKIQSKRHLSSCLLKACGTNSFIKFINVKAHSENLFVRAVLLNYEYQ